MFLNTDFLCDQELCLRLERTTPADPARGWLPAYHFFICDAAGTKMGKCDLRVGHNENTYYGGNIGYEVDPPYRGHHYAAKACKLLFELSRRHGMTAVYITCDPANIASARTCELAGLRYVDTVALPPENDMFKRGKTHVRIYEMRL